MFDSSKTILIVDDEVDICELLALQMELKGLSVLSANNGLDALEVVKLNEVNLILSDVRMPKGDGIMLLKELRQRKNEVPLIFMSGYTDISEDEAIRMGAMALLHKPLDSSLLEKYLSRALSC